MPFFYLPVLLAVTIATAMFCKNLLLQPLICFPFTFLFLSNHFMMHFHISTLFKELVNRLSVGPHFTITVTVDNVNEATFAFIEHMVVC
mgnify:FL=1